MLTIGNRKVLKEHRGMLEEVPMNQAKRPPLRWAPPPYGPKKGHPTKRCYRKTTNPFLPIGGLREPLFLFGVGKPGPSVVLLGLSMTRLRCQYQPLPNYVFCPHPEAVVSQNEELLLLPKIYPDIPCTCIEGILEKLTDCSGGISYLLTPQ